MLTRSICICLLLSLSACNSAPVSRSTRMTAGDLDAIGAAMAQSLAADDELRNRTPQSEPWVISTDKVQNLSTDVMTESEKWYVIYKLQDTLPIRTMSQQRNITFVIPKEQVDAMRANPKLEMGPETGFGAQRTPTHQMNATFMGTERAVATERTDNYRCQFEIINLATGEPVWIDAFSYKRGATGHVWD